MIRQEPFASRGTTYGNGRDDEFFNTIDPLRTLADCFISAPMRKFSVVAALALMGCVHIKQEPFAYAFASGPNRSVSLLVNAIGACNAPATVVSDGERASVLLDEKRSQAAFDCLSLWVHQHPEANVEKVGFVWTEQSPQP